MELVIEIPRSGSPELEVEGRRLTLRDVERTLWPVAQLTKADLLDYYARMAPVLLPHVAGRPLRVVRFPDGVHLRGLVDSDMPGAPEWVRTRDGAPLVTGVASLLWLVDLATVELHVPLGPDPEAPAFLVFEIEAGAGRGLEDCCVVAMRLRAALTADGLAAHAKTSGAFGLHVAVPINGGSPPAVARAYAREVAERLAEEDPQLVTSDGRRQSRTGRVLVDWRPNAPRRWTIAPYSLRAMLPGPGVSAPVGWDDVSAGADGQLEALQRSPQDVLAAAERDGDAWRPVLDTVQSVPDA